VLISKGIKANQISSVTVETLKQIFMEAKTQNSIYSLKIFCNVAA